MKCCAIATEHHVSVSWGVDSPPETFLEEMRKWLVKYRGEEHDLKALVERLFGCELPDDWSPSEDGDPPERRRLRRGPVRCLETGVVYPSQSAAAEALFLSPSMVGKTLRGMHKNPTYHFEYASADDLPIEGEAATEAA